MNALWVGAWAGVVVVVVMVAGRWMLVIFRSSLAWLQSVLNRRRGFCSSVIFDIHWFIYTGDENNVPPAAICTPKQLLQGSKGFTGYFLRPLHRRERSSDGGDKYRAGRLIATRDSRNVVVANNHFHAIKRKDPVCCHANYIFSCVFCNNCVS